MALTAYLLLLGLALTSYASYKPRFTANVSFHRRLERIPLVPIREQSANVFQFDNLTAPAVSDPVPDVGTYEFITYNSFSLGDTADEVVGGIAAYTEPNAIVTNSEQQGIDGTPSLTIAEPYTFLDLTDFWFGCSLHTGLAAVGLATQCTIVVAGFQSNSDIEIALASFTFTPPPLQDRFVI